MHVYQEFRSSSMLSAGCRPVNVCFVPAIEWHALCVGQQWQMIWDATCIDLQMTWTKPHILLLDEPSNHLDIDACNALIEGLATFKGGVLMVRATMSAHVSCMPFLCVTNHQV